MKVKVQEIKLQTKELTIKELQKETIKVVPKEIRIVKKLEETQKQKKDKKNNINKDKFAKIVFFVLSILIAIFTIYGLYIKELVFYQVVLFMLLAIFCNPYITDKVALKSGASKIPYSLALLPALIIIILFLSLFLTAIFSKKLSSVDEFNGVFQLILYFSFLILFLKYKVLNRKNLYLIFGVIYTVFTASTLSPDTINSYISYLINLIPNYNSSPDDIKFFVYNFLSPIKEAMLTFIIFEVVQEYSSKQKIRVKDNYL